MNKEEPIYIVICARDYDYDEWEYLGTSLEEARKVWKDKGGYDRLVELYPDGSMNTLGH